MTQTTTSAVAPLLVAISEATGVQPDRIASVKLRPGPKGITVSVKHVRHPIPKNGLRMPLDVANFLLPYPGGQVATPTSSGGEIR